MRVRFPLPAPFCIKGVFYLSRHVRGLYSSFFVHQFLVLQSGVEQFGSSRGS
ncbi:LOW QUALITY PROTEIN: hypothetical protein CFC21_108975 [Triticum aestivum]|uniref:Uncharacterized protein n=2 Tax=Triticum aestivum TaxID=4565 RepID=A0A341ZL62_WHEAT|nr:LOW QUALITY PROTEIN: hypothetical protein CFC21_008764 [Triticum aestivum]KAF7108525.1 LOW QUALITY PROTEIN: hypothetical protein CFC21_108975 [Triticum aestivum]